MLLTEISKLNLPKIKKWFNNYFSKFLQVFQAFPRNITHSGPTQHYLCQPAKGHGEAGKDSEILREPVKIKANLQKGPLKLVRTGLQLFIFNRMLQLQKQFKINLLVKWSGTQGPQFLHPIFFAPFPAHFPLISHRFPPIFLPFTSPFSC